MNAHVQLGLGIVALSFFWVHCLLIAAAAVQDLRDLSGWARRWAGATKGVVKGAAGPEGVFARWRVQQTGRCRRSESTIWFHDREHTSELFGGEVAIEGDALSVAPVPNDAAVWHEATRRAKAVADTSGVDLAAALTAARKARGYVRDVDLAVREGDTVWLSVDRACVATFDPRSWIGAARLKALAFILGHLTVAGACTALALWPPRFGTVSMVGALAALLYFLTLAQPVGVWLHQRLRSPDRAFVRGNWKA